MIEALLIHSPVVYFFLPETRKHSLEDMDTIFRTAKSSSDVVRVGKELARASGHHLPAYVTTKSKEDAAESGSVENEKTNVRTVENI